MRPPRVRFTIGRMMAWVVISALVLGPAARYASASPEGRAWWELVGRLSGGIMLAMLTISAPYLVGFWDEFRDRRRE